MPHRRITASPGRLADVITWIRAEQESPGRLGALVELPGLWGLPRLRDALSTRAARGRDVIALHRERAPGRETIVVVADRDDPEIDEFVERAREHRVFLIVVAPPRSTLPEEIASLLASGSMRRLFLQPLPHALLGRVLRTDLGRDISPQAVSRLHAFSQGHPALLELVIEAARTAGVLVVATDRWEWHPDDAALKGALAWKRREFLSGLSAGEADELRLVACSGRLSVAAVELLLGAERTAQLRGRLLLTVTGRGEDTVLRIGPEALQVLLSGELDDRARADLWRRHGYRTDDAPSSPENDIGRTLWRRTALGPPEPAIAADLARTALGLGWFTAARSLAPEAVDDDGEVLLARVDLAFGLAEEALERLRDITVSGAVRREAMLLAARIAVFHREDGLEVWDRLLSEADGAEGLDDLVRVVELGRRNDVDGLDAPSLGRTAEEAFTIGLWRGLVIGFGRDPYRGRRILTRVIDAAAREPGSRELLEPAAAVMIMLQLQFAWRTDFGELPEWCWEHSADRPMGLFPLDDLSRAIEAMQDDQMGRCAELALRALRWNLRSDPYNLAEVSWTLASAARSYLVDPAYAAAPLPVERSAVKRGVTVLRHVSDGLGVIGRSQGDGGAAEQIFQMALEAEAAGQPGQRDELFMLALLGGHRGAWERVRAQSTPGATGRREMSREFAVASLDPDPAGILDAVEHFLDGGAGYFAGALLAGLWPKRAELGELQIRAVRLGLRAVVAAGAASWVLEPVRADLQLDDKDAEIVWGLSEGVSTAAIADSMDLSARTVEGRISRLLKRFGARNRIELVSLDPTGGMP